MELAVADRAGFKNEGGRPIVGEPVNSDSHASRQLAGAARAGRSANLPSYCLNRSMIFL